MRINVPADTPKVMDEKDQPTFEQWMERVDGLVMRHASVSIYDLPDCPYYDWYNQRLKPVRAANKVLTMATEDLIYG